MMIANNSGESHLMNPSFDGLPLSQGEKVYYTVQRIEARNGSACNGLEKGTTHRAKLNETNDKRTLKLPTLGLPQHSITMITMWPVERNSQK